MFFHTSLVYFVLENSNFVLENNISLAVGTMFAVNNNFNCVG